MSRHALVRVLKNRWNPCLSWVSGQPRIRTFGSQSINFSLGQGAILFEIN